MSLKSEESAKVPSLQQLINLNWQEFEGGLTNNRCFAGVNYALANFLLLYVQGNNLLVPLVENFKHRFELAPDSLSPGPGDIELIERTFNKNIDTIAVGFYKWLTLIRSEVTIDNI